MLPEDLSEYIEKNYWGTVKVIGKNIISLLNFFKNGEPCQIEISEEERTISVTNFLMNINKSEYRALAEELTQNFNDVEIDIESENLTLRINKIESDFDFKNAIDKIFTLYDYIFEKFGGISEREIGIRKFVSMGKPIYIIDRSDIENLKLVRGLFITKPTSLGEYLTSYGDDTVITPVLSWRNESGELIATYISREGKLEKFNLTKYKEKLNDILNELGLQERVEEETLLDLEKLNEIIYKIKLKTESKTDIFNPVSSNEAKVSEKLKPAIRDLVRESEKIMQLKAFDNYVREKVLLKIIAYSLSTEENKLQAIGAKQLLTTKIRTVTKLGGGKAIYIGKEELRQIDLKDKAVVSVIQLPTGKKILLIEPESEK